MWKEYSKRDNEQIVELNARARKMHEKKIHNIILVAKQGVYKTFGSSHTF
jgi:hypothetical protein